MNKLEGIDEMKNIYEDWKQCDCGRIKISNPTPDGDEICPDCGQNDIGDYEPDEVDLWVIKQSYLKGKEAGRKEESEYIKNADFIEKMPTNDYNSITQKTYCISGQHFTLTGEKPKCKCLKKALIEKITKTSFKYKNSERDRNDMEVVSYFNAPEELIDKINEIIEKVNKLI